MKRKYIGLALGTLVVAGVTLSLPSCGHDQKLVSLEIQPGTFTFLDPYAPPPAVNVTEQYMAIATYIHPPATKDVTSQATWKIDDGVVTMSTPGLFTAAPGFCGGGNISASVPEGTGGSSNIVIAYATVTVNNSAVTTCPGGGTEGTLSVQIAPSQFGTVTSLSYGINCPSVTCIAQVPVGASVALTASPLPGHTFLNWQGCTTTSTNVCTITIPTGGAGLVANFQ
jgi:Divergent InlB B-repeat domain